MSKLRSQKHQHRRSIGLVGAASTDPGSASSRRYAACDRSICPARQRRVTSSGSSATHILSVRVCGTIQGVTNAIPTPTNGPMTTAITVLMSHRRWLSLNSMPYPSVGGINIPSGRRNRPAQTTSDSARSATAGPNNPPVPGDGSLTSSR